MKAGMDQKRENKNKKTLCAIHKDSNKNKKNYFIKFSIITEKNINSNFSIFIFCLKFNFSQF